MIETFVGVRREGQEKKRKERRKKTNKAPRSRLIFGQVPILRQLIDTSIAVNPEEEKEDESEKEVGNDEEGKADGTDNE